jgi:hypothetical protein
MTSIFLSHSWTDKFFAKKLAEKLAEYGIEVWIDEAEIRVGESIIQKISDAIKKTDYVAVILSHNSVDSEWVQKELSLAISREIAEEKVKVLPILLEKCSIPEFLKDKLYADFTDREKFDESFSKLLHAIGISETAVPVIEESKIEPAVPIRPNSALVLFDDIKIIRVDKIKTHRPDSGKNLYHVYFKLSDIPPKEWVQIFDEERRFARHSVWRNAWIENDYIIVHCGLDEVEKYHFKDLKQDTAITNKKYRNYLYQILDNQEKKQRKELKEREDIDKALDGLDFRP